jgi:predicted AlkP superfamily pyrophosphatase or phosphodiesterase
MLYDMAARGQAPTIARLIENGTAFRHGAIASLPTVTLPNHTTLLTGCHPGHHGVLHNAWYDRELGRQVVTESASTWQEAMRWLAPGIQTIHEALAQSRPGACTISVNEPADRGATYSTFDLLRNGRGRELAGMLGTSPDPTTTQFAEASTAYKWGTTVDASSVGQACALIEGTFPGKPYPAPAFMWVNTSLTDAASHEGGPHSEMALAAVRDTDARISEVLDTLDRKLGSEGTTVVVVADHGMELNNPENTGDWADALAEAGIPFRDEASGFLYFGAEFGDDA